MRYVLHFFACLLMLTAAAGCLAVAAGAAGAAAAESSDDAVARYIDTHEEVAPHIAEAMYNGEIVQGMSKEEALFMARLKGYGDCEEVETPQENTSEWVCEDNDPMRVGKYAIRFKNGKLVSSEL